MEEKVSVIIPVYNAENWISETIQSVKAQSYKNYEIILIDDASTDQSVQKIEPYLRKNIFLLKNEQNCGVAISRNKGLECATGRYICFLDADDFWSRNKLKKQIEFMKEKRCAFSYTAFRYTDEKGKTKGKKVNVPLILNYQHALKDTRILTISVMFDTEKIEKRLLQMPNIKSEDIATWWKILKNGYLAYGLNEDLVYYRRGHQTMTSNKISWSKNRWRLYRETEGLSIIKSLYYFIHYAFYAIIKRI